jgi:PHD/YefM family antitoxin component YafN of YafNO toxin-antitoxin module
VRNGAVTVAHGEFVEKILKWPVSEKDLSKGFINVIGSKRVMVCITKVVAPSFICYPEEEFPFDLETCHSELDSDSGSESGSDSGEEFLASDQGTTRSSQPAADHQFDEELEEYSRFRPRRADSDTSGRPIPTHFQFAPSHSTRRGNNSTTNTYLPGHSSWMDGLRKHIPREHSLAKQFSRWLRDAIFVPDKLDKARVEAVLKKKGRLFGVGPIGSGSVSVVMSSHQMFWSQS